MSREFARRAEKTVESEELLMEGRDAYAKGDYEEAVQNYTRSLNALPGGKANEERRRVMEQHLADGTVALAQKYRRTGRYEEAREKLENILTVDPENQRVKQELEYLDDPIRTKSALSYEHAENVDKVRRHLYTAEGYKNLGLYDEAIREYQDTLRTDPYNKAARRGMEQIHKLKDDHYASAYDEGRARLLGQVDEGWDMTVPPPATRPGDGVAARRIGPRPQPKTPVNPVEEKLEEVVIPEIDFDDTTVEEAVDYLRERARELDQSVEDPSQKGINFVIRKPRIEGGGVIDEELDAEGGLGAVDPGTARVKGLKLKNVTVKEALQHIAEQSRLRYKVDEHAVTLLPLGSGEGDDVLTRKWKVGRGFLAELEKGSAGEGDDADPFGGDDTGLGSGSLKPRRSLKEMLQATGIDFPPGASAQFIPSTGTLIVSNTPQNLDLMDQLAEQTRHLAPQIDFDKFDSLFQRGAQEESEREEMVRAKLENIIVPVIDFDDVTVEEAVDFLRQRAREIDGFERDASRRGLSIRVKQPRVAQSEDEELDVEGGLGAERSGAGPGEGAEVAKRPSLQGPAVHLRAGPPALQD